MNKPGGTRWAAVSVVTPGGGCDAARALKGKRFLGTDAPRLPLNECATPASCRCAYRKYPDRRDGPRREEEETGIRRGITQTDRRVRRGRRSTD